MLDAIYLIFNVTCLAAGLCGAIVHVWNEEGATPKPKDVMRHLVTGMLGANFIAPQMFRIMPWLPIEFIAFGVGMAGKHLCLGIELFFSKVDMFGKTKNE